MRRERRGTPAAPWIVLAAVACSCLPDPEALATPKLEVHGADIVATQANVEVRRDGAPLADASVVVNGQAIPPVPGSAGLYSGPIPTPLAAGEAVTLQVTSGPSRVLGIATVPETPAVTSPSSGALLAPGTDVVVTWTSAADPGYFTVVAQWSCGAGCSTGASFDADRAARSFTIPATALPPARDVRVSVLAYDDGALVGDYAPFDAHPGMNVRADSNAVALFTSDRPTLQVWGADMGGAFANVYVARAGIPVNDATVVVNGQAIPRSASADGLYSDGLATTAPAGGTLALEVTSGTASVTGTGTVPDAPALTAPGMGAFFPATADVPVTWTTPTEPDYFVVSAQWSCGTACGTGWSFEAPPSARSFTIPASSLPSGKTVTLTVFGYRDGALSGDYLPFDVYPGMNIRAESDPVLVTH